MRRPGVNQSVFILHVSAVKKRLKRQRSSNRNTESIVEFYITQGNVAVMRRMLRDIAGVAIDVRDVTIAITDVVGLKIRKLSGLVKDKVGVHVR